MESEMLTRFLRAVEAIAQPRSFSEDGRHDDTFEDASVLLATQAERMILWHRSTIERLSEKTSQKEQDLIVRRLDDVACTAMSRFYAYRFDQLPSYWRHLYTETLILIANSHVIQSMDSAKSLIDPWIDKIVANLDRALITSGSETTCLEPNWVDQTLEMLDQVWRGTMAEVPPSKRRRIDQSLGGAFSTIEPYGRPTLRANRTCERHRSWTIEMLERHIEDGRSAPVVFTDLISDWPALNEHPWKKSDYLLSQTLGGKRLVPVEVGRSYVDEGWGQEVIPFKDFLARYISPDLDPDTNANAPSIEDPEASQPRQVGYLAQHNLFRQASSLRNDIRIPDLCWADVPSLPPSSPPLSKRQPKTDVPQLNAWFGPAKTITPLHTDAYYNLLCQVVGTKYIRLYPPEAEKAMRPRGLEGGVDMSNTSTVDVGLVEGWDEPAEGGDSDDGNEDIERVRERLKDVEYWECVLEPGDTLLIPIGWWHYVRSLSISFSVSFWWN